LATVLNKDEIHHVIFAVVGEININVRQLVKSHALLVQEASEIKAEANWTNVGNSEAIADQRVSRAAARDPFDSPLLTGLQQIPSDEEVVLIPDFRDDTQFFLDLCADLRERHVRARFGNDPLASVTTPQPIEHEATQKLARS